MHRILLVQEIIDLILQNFLPDKESKEQRITLRNTALTCSAFLDPALNALWSYMEDLTPLFKLLSNFIYSSEESVPSVIFGRVLEAEICTFKKYASRIRRYSCGQRENVDFSAYYLMLRASGQKCLLPNLQHLETMHNAPEIMFLLSSPLCNFSLKSEGPVNATAIANSIQTISPHIVSLDLEKVILNPHFLAVLCRFSHLQHLDIDVRASDSQKTPFDLSFLLNSSTVSTLRHFHLSGSEDTEIIWAIDFPNGQLEFSALQSIEVQCAAMSMGPFVKLLRCATFPKLESLTITLLTDSVKPEKTEEAHHWHDFFELLGTVTSKQFKNLKFTSYNSGYRSAGDFWGTVGLSVYTFPKLDRLSLSSFVVTGPFLQDVGQNDIRKIIKTWPQLTDLGLCCSHSTGIDFLSLIDIVLGLPHLRWLKIPIDASHLPNLEEVPLLCHGLNTIHLRMSSVMDANLFIQYLDRIFPRLAASSFTSGDELDSEDDSDDEWREAGSLLRILQQARRDEAMRASLEKMYHGENNVKP